MAKILQVERGSPAMMQRGHKVDDCLFYSVDINPGPSPHVPGWQGLQRYIGIALGVVIGLAIIYIPLLVQQAGEPSLMVSGTRDGNQTSATADGGEDGVGQWERLPMLVAIIGLGVGIAYAAYHLARGRQA